MTCYSHQEADCQICADYDERERIKSLSPVEAASEIASAISRVQHESRDHEVNGYKLARRWERRRNLKPNQTTPIWVSVTSTTREYGGPEEGGWWFNWTEVEEVFKVWTAKEALAVVRRWRDEYPQPRYSIYSCANTGDAQHQIHVDSDPSYFEARESTERPTYC